MKTVILNEKQFDNVVADMFHKFNEYGSLQLEYQKPFKDKTLRQLGFIFGGIIDSVIEYYLEIGERWEVEDVKENFYSATSYLDERLQKKVKRFNGEEYIVPKRLSEMNVDEASVFIDKCIWLIDNAKNFKDLVLRPELRYTWVRNITKDDLYNIKDVVLPREDPDYLHHTRSLACIHCGRTHGSQIHHLKIAGLSATAYKSDDWATVPLCFDCHLKMVHQLGQDLLEDNLKWITKYISLVDFCKIRYMKWKNKC